MRKRIVRQLENIESDKDVQILYACESGSRAWGFASKDSDFDVRFIYLHPINWYLSISDKRDVIERNIDDCLDISGWEFRKALQLFRKSNPVLLEWLQSPIVYMEKYIAANKLRDLMSVYFSPKSCLYHYLHMARGNYREFLGGDQVWLKKYFYVLRPVLACRWIEATNTMPPTEFDKLVESQVPTPRLRDEIVKLLEMKKTGAELKKGSKIQVINNFLESEIERYKGYIANLPKSNPPSTASLDKLFQTTLSEVWEV